MKPRQDFAVAFSLGELSLQNLGRDAGWRLGLPFGARRFIARPIVDGSDDGLR